MSNIQNITVTDSRLRKAVQKVSANEKINTSNGTGTSNEDTCTLLEAKLVKWFIGLDKVILSINDKEEEAYINYPFIDNDFIISVIPEGGVVESEDGNYIEPENTQVNVLKYGSKYCVLGFKQDTSTKTPDVGEILLQAGDNSINISKEFINITTNALFINGVKYEK